MKIFDEVKGFVNRSKVIQTFLTLYKWGKRINSHWDNLVRNTGSKYDILRVPLAIFMVTTVFLLGYLPANAWAVGTADEHNIWVAYTVGDVSFMHSVLRAVSMIMYGDGGVIQGAYRLACLLGIIWLIVKGIFSKQVIDIGSGFFVIFFYMCFFVPQSTLHIEDLQTKKYYTMEKIPLGVSVTLSLTSRIGKYFTDAYETVFVESSADSALCSAGSMNCNGYMGTLDMIAKARSSLQNHAAYLAINKAMCNGSEDISSCDIERSILNYTKDCTVQKIMSPTERFTLKNVTGFKVNGDTQKEMKFNSKRHYTKVYAGPGKDGVMNCLEAGNFIARAFENNRVKTTIYNMAFPHHNLTTAGGAVNDGGSGTDNGTREGTYDVAAMQTDMDAALGGLGGQTADSYEYLKNVLIRPLMEKGLRDGFIDQNQLSAQIALDTAISQRNLQLAAESSMFATMIRPLTTFLEGFVLALTPLMPFILLLGINAFGVVMKYLLVLFWIQLWAPALAICNMYVQNVVKENLALALGGTDITSFTGIETATPVIQHWLAVGGMMGASVPVLTLFILSGSIYTFNTLATSIKGGDHFDEKAIQPDAIKRAAFINTSVGSYNMSTGGGSTVDGTSSAYATMTSSDVASISESAAHAEKEAKSNQYLDAVLDSMANSKSASHNRAIVKNAVKALQANNQKAYTDLVNLGRTTTDGKNVNLTDSESAERGFMAMLAARGYIKVEAGAKAKVGTPGLLESFLGASAEAYTSTAVGGEGSVAVQGQGSKKATDTTSISTSTQLLDEASKMLNSNEGKSWSQLLSQTLSGMDQSSITEGSTENHARNVNNSFSELKTAEDTYNKVNTNTSSYNKSKSYRTDELATQVLEDKPENENKPTKRAQLLAWMDNNKDFTRGIINSSYGKGKAENLTGATASLIEYAKDNKNDKEAQELLSIMQLDDYLGKGEANNGVDSSNTLQIKPDKSGVEDAGNRIERQGRQNLSGTQSSVDSQTGALNEETNEGIEKTRGQVDAKHASAQDREKQEHDSAKNEYDVVRSIVGDACHKKLNDDKDKLFQKRINATLDGLNEYKYNRDTITAIDVTKDGKEMLRFKDGSSVPMVNVESMDLQDRLTFDISELPKWNQDSQK